MEGLAILGLAVLIWILIGPVFGIIAMNKANRASRELEHTRAELSSLRRRFDDDAVSDAPAAAPERPEQAAAAQTATSVPITPPHTAPPPPTMFTPPTEEEPPSSAVPPPPEQKPSSPPGPEPSRDWERLIAANWMVWAGGLALALGGLFLVRVAIDAGYFGPLQRTIAAAIFGGGLITAAFRALDLETVKRAKNAVRYVPQVVAGAGLVALYGSAIASGLIYQFVPPLAAFALIAAISALGVGLSMRFGPALAAPSLVGAYAAPLLTGAEGGSVLPVMPYFAIITAGGLALVRLSGWRWLTWLLVGGAGFWGLVASAGEEVATPIVLGAYALSLAIMGLFFGGKDAERALVLPKNGIRPAYIMAGFGSSQLAAHVFWVFAGALILLTGWQAGAGLIDAASLALFGGLGLFAAWQRPGYALIAPIAAGITLVCLSLWAIDQPPLVWACLASALGFGLGGTVLMRDQELRTPLALSAALTPPAALFIAFWREGGLEPHFGWGLTALFIAVSMSSVLEQLHREDPDFKTHPGAGASYALGALLSLALAPFLVFGGFWLGSTMAIVALGIAIIHQRFDLSVLRFGAMAATALAVGLLVRPGFVDPSVVSSIPIWNSMTFGFAIAIAALFAGSRLFGSNNQERQAFEAGALILIFVLIALTIRHVSGEGALDGPFAGIGEASAYAIAYLGMAASFAWRLSDKAKLFKFAEYVAAVIGVVAIALAASHIGRGTVGSMPIINLLAAGFAMPALLLAAYAAGLRRAGRFEEGLLASGGAMFVGFLWVTLEVARTFGGPAMQDFYGDFGWAYSPAWIGYAVGLLVWGAYRVRRAPRYASLAILLLALAKVFLIDMAALEGAARAGSFIGLGGSLIAIALFYQRFVFGTMSGSLSERSQPPSL
ncbi:MAG: DUF2339 domain-containing protein [Pseudomonadota bacterium]